MEFLCNLNTEEQNSSFQVSNIVQFHGGNSTKSPTERSATKAGVFDPFKFKFSSFCSGERRNRTLTFIERSLHYHFPYLTRNHRNKYHAHEFSRNFHFPNYIFEYEKNHESRKFLPS